MHTHAHTHTSVLRQDWPRESVKDKILSSGRKCRVTTEACGTHRKPGSIIENTGLVVSAPTHEKVCELPGTPLT